MLLPIPKQITVISPHLDDAVFSCGSLLAGSLDALVITVFAGIPDPCVKAPAWDKAAGFTSGHQAVLARRKEDAESMRRLGARGAWLHFWDGQYGRCYDPIELIPPLRTVLQQRGGAILMPMGLVHPDHLLTSNACLAVREELLLAQQPARNEKTCHPAFWLVYEEAIYRRDSAAVDIRLAAWKRAGLGMCTVRFPTSNAEKKAYAVNAYQSQLPLFGVAKRTDIGLAERYWRLDAEPLHY